jgi:hypothetical protein
MCCARRSDIEDVGAQYLARDSSQPFNFANPFGWDAALNPFVNGLPRNAQNTGYLGIAALGPNGFI